MHSTNNEISLKNGDTSEIAVISDESNTKTIIAAVIDRDYDLHPLRIILYSPIVFFNETGLDIGISDFSDECVRYFSTEDKMLMAGNKHFFPENSDEKNQRENHSFKLYYQTDHIGAFEINPNTLNIDQNLLIPLNGNTDFVHYADASMTYYAGNAFEAGNDMKGEESLYLPLHYNVRSNQPDSRTLIVTLFCQVQVLNELKFDIYLQPVIDKTPFGEKMKIPGKSTTPVPITSSSTTYQFQVTTSDPSQQPIVISLEQPCRTNFFMRRPISSKKSKQTIIVPATSDTQLSENTKLDYVNLRTEIVSTDFIATFSKGTFSDSPYIILNRLSTKITYTQKKEPGFVSAVVEPQSSSILAFTHPFAHKHNIVYIDVCGTEISIDMEEPEEQQINDPTSNEKNKKMIYINCFIMKGKQVILLSNDPYTPQVLPSTQYYLTLSGFEFSLINSKNRESVLLNLGSIGVQYRINANTKTKVLDAGISSFRIDNLTEKAIWPVVVYSGKTSDKAYFVKCTLEMPSDERKDSVISNVNVSIQPLLVAVDTSFVEAVYEFVDLLSSESKKAGIIKPLQSSTSRHLMTDVETIIENYDLADIAIYLNYSKNKKVHVKETFINLIPNIKDFEVKISRKARSEYNMPMSQLQNDLINDIKNDVLKASTIMSAVTKISANQASAKTKLKFVSGITVPNTRIREARPLPMKQILQYNEDEAFMQRAIRDRAKSDEVVEMFNTTQDGRIICLSDNYVSIFKKAPETATVKYEIENMYKYNQLNTIQAVDEILRFLAPPKGADRKSVV